MTGAVVTRDFRVELWEEMIDDMDIFPGDLIVFRKNDAGRWEVWLWDEIEDDGKLK